jgi:hypothetical protein
LPPWLAEAVLGLLREISFNAPFTQRFFNAKYPARAAGIARSLTASQVPPRLHRRGLRFGCGRGGAVVSPPRVGYAWQDEKEAHPMDLTADERRLLQRVGALDTTGLLHWHDFNEEGQTLLRRLVNWQLIGFSRTGNPYYRTASLTDTGREELERSYAE